jgi:cell division inhibitor SepF
LPKYESEASNRGMFEKFLNFFGFEAEEIIEQEETALQDAHYHHSPRERGKLVKLNNTTRPVKMLIIEPESFEEVQVIVDHLKNKRVVIINLEETEKGVARRIADFVGGAIYALDGSMQRINGSIFLFTPAHIEVAMPLHTDFRQRDKEREISSPSASTFFRSERER